MSISNTILARKSVSVNRASVTRRAALPLPEDSYFVATYVEGELRTNSITRPMSLDEAEAIRDGRESAEPDCIHVLVPEAGRDELIRASWPRREAAEAEVTEFIAERYPFFSPSAYEHLSDFGTAI